MMLCSVSLLLWYLLLFFFFFKQKTAYEMRISDWSSDVCAADLTADGGPRKSPISWCSASPAKRVLFRLASLPLTTLSTAGKRGLSASPPGRSGSGSRPAMLSRWTCRTKVSMRSRCLSSAWRLIRQRQRSGLRQRRRLHLSRSEEHTSELQSLMRISYAVFCLQKKITNNKHTH